MVRSLLSRRFSGWLAIALLLGLTASLLQGNRPRVEAHALLLRADPPANAQLPQAPSQVTLYFSEELERRFSSVRVTDQNRQRVDDRVEFDPSDKALMRVFLKELTPGYLTVVWENVSAVDGHRLTGSFPLTILNPDGSPPAGRALAAETSSVGTTAKPERVVNRWLALVAASVLLGAFAFMFFVTPALPGSAGQTAGRALDRWSLLIATIAWVIVVAANGSELLLQAREVGVSVSDVINTRWGERWLWRLTALAAPLAAIVLGLYWRNSRRSLAFIGLAGTAAYLVIAVTTSHAAAGAGSFWSVSVDFIHVLAATTWTGLLALVIGLFIWSGRNLPLGERYGVLATALQRFSTVAVVSVALLFASGTFNALVEIQSLADMLNSGYGLTLLIKLLLLVPLLGVGASNAFLLRPRLVQVAQASGRLRLATLTEIERRLHRNVRWELGLVLLVVAVAALLAQQTPTRGRVGDPNQTAGKFVSERTSQGISATLVIEPNQPGLNTFSVYLTGAIDQVESVRLEFTPPTTGERARLVMEPSNPPTFYVGNGPFLDQAGRWRVAVDIRRSQGADLTIPFAPLVATPLEATVASGRSSGSFAAPVNPSPSSAVLLAAVVFGAAGLTWASLRPVGLSGGYAGVIAKAVSRRISSAPLRPVWLQGGLLVAGVALGLLLGSHVHSRLSQKEAKFGNPVEASAASIDKGQVIFIRNCAMCHGESGRGDGPIAATLPIKPANLYDHVPYHPDQFFFSVITNGLSGVMPAFGNGLSEEDRWNVMNFLRQQFGQPPATR